MNKLFQIICIFFVISSCSKSSSSSAPNTDFFPPVVVNIQGINLSFGTYTQLIMPGGYYYFTGGNRGIVMYHTTNDDYVAFDRTCPVDPTKPCSYVGMDSLQLFYKCSNVHTYATSCNGAGFCNSTFLPDLGIQQSGSATRGLKQYHVTRTTTSGGDVLTITN